MGEKLDSDILAKLAEPFRPDQVRWKPQVVSDSGNALAVPYVDPRVVSERLDQVVGGDWAFHWEPLGVQGDRLVVKSSLTLMGVTREDVGEHVLSDREQADPWKSAVSDALKRAAVHFGVGRYLYWLDAPWCAYDRRKREFIDEPYIDAEGNVRIRRRQGEPGQPSNEMHNRERRDRPAEARTQTAARGQSSRPSPGTHSASHPARVQEAAEGEYGVPWGNDLINWAVRYLEHQNVRSAEATEVLKWLVEHDEMQADLAGYPALSDAQAAFIRGLPGYVQAHSES
ncbi:MAG: Rad52/Rad22 family DNA repair protein [Anaerolineae bacterium]